MSDNNWMAQQPQVKQCHCEGCEIRRVRGELGAVIFVGAQAAAIAFGPSQLAGLGPNQLMRATTPSRPVVDDLKTHHRSCALRKGGTTCTC